MSALFPGNDFFHGNFAPADFGDAEETRPTESTDIALIPLGENQERLSIAVENLMRKHTAEIQGRGDIVLSAPGVNYANQLRRKLREFYLREQQTIFSYLEQSNISTPIINGYSTIIRRFCRPDFSLENSTLKDLAVDLSGGTVLPALQDELGFDLATFTGSIGKFINCIKETTDEIMRAENALKLKVAAIDKLTQSVQGILTLNATNAAYEGMIRSAEDYIREAIKENSIEESYNAVINAYKKLSLLKEAFNGIRLVSAAQTTEPLCSVCITEPVNYTLAPCGHTFCQGCTRKQNIQCFICRQVIRERVKLYFS
jgi:hypothetical protein